MPERNKTKPCSRAAPRYRKHRRHRPGIYCNYQSGDQKTLCQIFIMPGVPKKMKTMFTRDIAPKLKQQAGNTGQIILSKTLHTLRPWRVRSSRKIISDLMRRDRNPALGTTVSNAMSL